MFSTGHKVILYISVFICYEFTIPIITLNTSWVLTEFSFMTYGVNSPITFS